MAEKVLIHYGILGMHWGDRNGPPYPLSRSQASASEKRKGFKESESLKDLSDEELRRRVNRMNLEKQYIFGKTNTYDRMYNNTSDQISKIKDVNNIANSVSKNINSGNVSSIVNQVIDSTSDIRKRNRMINNRNGIDLLELDQMSDEDLRRAVERMNLEQRYIDMSTNSITIGEKYTNDATDILKNISSAAGSVAAIAGAVYALKKIL